MTCHEVILRQGLLCNSLQIRFTLLPRVVAQPIQILEVLSALTIM